MADILITNIGLLVGAMLILWLVAAWIADVSFIDAVWGGAMALLAVTSWAQLDRPGALATMIMVMTVLWGGRLALHLLLRWRRNGEDQRYARILRKFREKGSYAKGALLRVFGPQAVLLFITCLPAQLGIAASEAPAPITPLAWAGLVLWLVGIVFEWVGDWQLERFKADSRNSGKVLDSGLWRYSRHPNYFGDCCAWWGIWLAAASAGGLVALASLPGPIFLTFTLTRWSGKPLLERGMAKTRPDYADYIARTSAFVPLPPYKQTHKHG